MLTSDEMSAALGPFCDPGTGVEIRETVHQFELFMTRDGDRREYLVESGRDAIKARGTVDRKFVNLASLLASEYFADVRWMMEVQRRMADEFRHDDLLEPDGYLERGTLTSDLSSASLRATLTPKRAGNDDTLLRIALIDGPAGVGKTTLIRRLLSERARSAEFAPPVLHVTSRGRRLTNLPDALAQATQAVRARFTYDQVPTLARYGVLQIAIDGFDELVDADGYKDAWFAIAAFFDEVRVGGPIILSGRDTFFDEQSFTSRLFRGPRELELSQVHLTAVSPDRAQAFLVASGWNEPEVRAGAANYLRSGSYVLRPYFLSQIADARTWEAFAPPAATLRIFLIDRILRREAQLLSEMVTINSEQALPLLNRLFSEIALDMADSESDSIDLDVVALFVELIFEAALSEDDLAKVRHKAGSLATLETDQRQSRRRFSHSEIANVFLSQALLDALRAGEPPRFVRRGIIGTDLQEALQDVSLSIAPDALTRVFKLLDTLIQGSGLSDRQSSNCAAMRLALSTTENSLNLTLSHVAADEVRLSDAVPNTVLEDVHIGRLDARDSDMHSITMRDVTIGTLVVTESTKTAVEHCGSVGSLELHVGTRIRAIYGTDVAAWIRKHSDEDRFTSLQVSNQYTEYLERVCRKALRLFYLTESPDRSGPSILQNALWPTVRDALERRDRIHIRENLGARGPRKPYYHIIDAAALLDKDLPDSREIWHDLESLGSTT